MNAKETTDPLPDEAREALSKVYHDLNNPLSIISGNAQFLLEISRDADLDDAFITSVEDIREAADRMSEALRRLTEIRQAGTEE
ncbi:histidine kinase [Longibacter salinarum]|uniref:histidine kinase n=2 Tax=Longibacter salinarum TaxID=1850348 RepID=A0A2A8CZJ9_9BACT|nr:histidine kinase [Longibacter salinarum]